MVKNQKTVLTVNLDAIAHNAEVLQAYLKPGVKQMAVVKADAYGHGAVKVARKIASQVAWFAVNDVQEGIELRNNDIHNPVLVFNVPDDSTAAFYKKYHLTATISAPDHFEILLPGTNYHVNFNTGMGRLGFNPGQLKEVKKQVKNHSSIKMSGIYSHFATAGERGSDKMYHQLNKFREILTHFDDHLLIHFCNTAAAVQYPEAHYNMVRLGIGMYGYGSGQIKVPDLIPAMQWRTHLVQVNELKKGQTVSYGAKWKAPKNGFIGVIPVGYEDGIPRGMSGNFKVMIEDEIYPVVGTVTMNYCMIWLGDKKLEAGERVHLWNEKFTAQNWADTMNTITYEILTGVSKKYRTY